MSKGALAGTSLKPIHDLGQEKCIVQTFVKTCYTGYRLAHKLHRCEAVSVTALKPRTEK